MARKCKAQQAEEGAHIAIVDDAKVQEVAEGVKKPVRKAKTSKVDASKRDQVIPPPTATHE